MVLTIISIVIFILTILIPRAHDVARILTLMGLICSFSILMGIQYNFQHLGGFWGNGGFYFDNHILSYIIMIELAAFIVV